MGKIILKFNLLAIVIFLSSCAALFHPAPSTLPPNNRLHKAVVDNDIEKVRSLIKNPFRNINTKCRGRTALVYAVRYNNIEITKLLLDNGAIPDIPIEVTGCSPIHIASSNGNLEIVKLLVEHGSNPQLKTCSPNDGEWTRTPINEAQFNNHYKVIEYLKQAIRNKATSNKISSSDG